MSSVLETETQLHQDAGRERREFDRMDYRTCGAAYAASQGEDGLPVVQRVWTRDVSMTGARISANGDIPTRKIYLKLVLPQFRDTVIECEVVRRQQFVREAINGKQRQEFVFGVRFLHLHQNRALPEDVRTALEQGLAAGTPGPQ
jgi:hypothetical protein